MLKISVVDSSTERRLVLEGTLIAPWIQELRAAWIAAQNDLNGRKIIVDLENVTVIGQDGERALLELMEEGATFRSAGVLTTHVLQEIGRRARKGKRVKRSARGRGGAPKINHPARGYYSELQKPTKRGSAARTRQRDNISIRDRARPQTPPEHFEQAAKSASTSVSDTPENPGAGRTPRLKHHKKRWIVALLILLVIAGCIVWATVIRHPATNTSTAANKIEPVPITTATAKLGSVTSYLEAIGTVTPVYTDYITSQITAVITSVHYRQGQTIHRGDLLVDLDDRPYTAQLEEAQGALLHDENLLSQAQMDLKRYTEAWTRNGIPRQTLEDQQKLVLQYQGTVKADQGTVRYDETQVEYCHITSPITGRVGLRLVDPGNLAVANSTTALLVITQMQPTTVIFTVAQDSLGEIRDQMRRGVKVPVEAWDRQMSQNLGTGSLLTIDNQIDTTTGTVKARALFSNPKNALFPNQFVNTRMPVNTLQKQVLIPSSAVQQNGQTSFVYVIKNDKAILTNVKTGASNQGMVAVQGIQAGDVIANSSFEKLQNGSPVTISAEPVPSGTSNENDTL